MCRVFGADDFEGVFGSRTSDRPPRVLTAPVTLGECIFSSLDHSDRLELGGYVVDLPGVGELAPVEPLSRRVPSLGPGVWWHPRSGVSIDLEGQHVVWLNVQAHDSALRPDRALTVAAARIVLERLARPARLPGWALLALMVCVPPPLY